MRLKDRIDDPGTETVVFETVDTIASNELPKTPAGGICVPDHSNP